jgi:hypothetical protein
MSEFVGQQMTSSLCFGLVLADPEDHLPPDREGLGLYRLGGGGRPTIRMHAHLAEVVAETWLHEASGCRVEGLAGCS